MLTGRDPVGGGSENRVLNSSVAERATAQRSLLRLESSDKLTSTCMDSVPNTVKNLSMPWPSSDKHAQAKLLVTQQQGQLHLRQIIYCGLAASLQKAVAR